MATKCTPKKSVKRTSYPLYLVLCPYHIASFLLHFLLHHLLWEVMGFEVEQGTRLVTLAH